MSFFVPRRRPSAELLDDENLSDTEMALSLRDLESVNTFWRSARALERFLLPRMEAGPRASCLILDLGAGAACVSRALARSLCDAGIQAKVVGVDRQWRHLAFGARQASAARRGVRPSRRPRGEPRGPSSPLALAADAFALPFEDGAADWIISNLFLHHFSPEENVRLFREAARVARRGFAMLDINRNLCVQLFVATIGRAAFRSTVSVQDGQASVRQAYTPEEALEFAHQALPDVSVRRLFPFRLLVTRVNGVEKADADIGGGA